MALTVGAHPAILLDCDPGHDDAIAIVVAAHTTELVGITTVHGNAPLDRTTYNARVMRDLLGIDVAVHSGASRPLLAAPASAAFVHGESGLDGADLPPPTRALDGADAVGFIIDTCRGHDGIWLVPTGPLTNIALALRAAPDLVDHVAGISLMGGGTFGNRTPMAEYNIWADPEAAAIVFDSGAPLVMTGLDTTHQFTASPDRIAAVRAIGGLLATTLADLLEFFSANYASRHETMTAAAVHDPLAVLALSHPDLFERTSRHVAVEVAGNLTRGMTVIDRRDLVDRPAPNCEVITDVDVDGAWATLNASVAAFSH